MCLAVFVVWGLLLHVLRRESLASYLLIGLEIPLIIFLISYGLGVAPLWNGKIEIFRDILWIPQLYLMVLCMRLGVFTQFQTHLWVFFIGVAAIVPLISSAFTLNFHTLSTVQQSPMLMVLLFFLPISLFVGKLLFEGRISFLNVLVSSLVLASAALNAQPSAFVGLGFGLGALIWLLSPVVTGMLIATGSIVFAVIIIWSDEWRGTVSAWLNINNVKDYNLVDIWQVYLNGFLESPLIGNVMFKADGISHAHNNFLQFLALYGAVGAAAFYLIAAALLFLSHNLFKRIPNYQAWPKSLLMFCFTSQVAFHVSGVFYSNFFLPEVGSALMFIWALTLWFSGNFNELPGVDHLKRSSLSRF